MSLQLISYLIKIVFPWILFISIGCIVGFVVFRFLITLGINLYLNYKEKTGGLRNKLNLFNKKRKGNVYTIHVSCSNCDMDGTRDVPKSTTVKDYMESAKCRNCGCQTLKLLQDD